jgi:hypothetical protein
VTKMCRIPRILILISKLNTIKGDCDDDCDDDNDADGDLH